MSVQAYSNSEKARLRKIIDDRAEQYIFSDSDDVSDADLIGDVASRAAALANENVKLLIAVGYLSCACQSAAKTIEAYLAKPGHLAELKALIPSLKDAGNNATVAYGGQIAVEHGQFIELLEYAHDTLHRFADGNASKQDLLTLMVSISCQLSPNSPAPAAPAAEKVSNG